MKRYIRITFSEVIEIDDQELIVPETPIVPTREKYHIWEDEKWKKFCKEHNFNHREYGKIYDLYLRLCAEGLV